MTSLHNRRLDAVAIIFIALLIFSLGRLFFIQFFRSSYLADLAKKQHNLFIELEPRRGAIYDTRLKIQAVNISVDSVYAAPNEIPDKDKETYIRALMPILNVEYDYLKNRLYRKKSFIWLARKVSLAQSEDIKRLNLKGIGFIKESKRCYPNGYLASQVIGFSGLDNAGLEGLELYYDQYLRGEPGWALYLRDAHQKKLGLWERMTYRKTATMSS